MKNGLSHKSDHYSEIRMRLIQINLIQLPDKHSNENLLLFSLLKTNLSRCENCTRCSSVAPRFMPSTRCCPTWETIQTKWKKFSADPKLLLWLDNRIPNGSGPQTCCESIPWPSSITYWRLAILLIRLITNLISCYRGALIYWRLIQ